MKYILLWMIATAYGVTSGSAEFDTDKACLEGRATMDLIAQGQPPASGAPLFTAFCMPKSK